MSRGRRMLVGDELPEFTDIRTGKAVVLSRPSSVLRTAQARIAGEQGVEWARRANTSKLSYAEVMETLDDMINEIEGGDDR